MAVTLVALQWLQAIQDDEPNCPHALKLPWVNAMELTLLLFAWFAGSYTGFHLDVANAINIALAFPHTNKVRQSIMVNVKSMQVHAITTALLR